MIAKRVTKNIIMIGNILSTKKRRVIAGIMGVVLALTVGAALYAQEGIYLPIMWNKANTANWQVFIDREAGYTFKYPEESTIQIVRYPDNPNIYVVIQQQINTSKIGFLTLVMYENQYDSIESFIYDELKKEKSRPYVDENFRKHMPTIEQIKSSLQKQRMGSNVWYQLTLDTNTFLSSTDTYKSLFFIHDHHVVNARWKLYQGSHGEVVYKNKDTLQDIDTIISTFAVVE